MHLKCIGAFESSLGEPFAILASVEKVNVNGLRDKTSTNNHGVKYAHHFDGTVKARMIEAERLHGRCDAMT